MDPRLWSPLWWSFGLIVVLGLAGAAVMLVRRRLGPQADDVAPASARTDVTTHADWISLLTEVQTARLPSSSWFSRAPVLVAQVATCPPALRAPLITALERAISHSNDPLTAASMIQVRAALAALPAA